MDRRDFLKSTGGLAAVAVSGTATAAKAEQSPAKRTVRFSHPWSESHAGLADDAHRLAGRIQSAIGDAVTIDVQAGQAATDGFVYAPIASDTEYHPAFAYFGGLPGSRSLAPIDLEGWLLTGGGQQLWDDLAAAHGFKPLLAGHTGTRPVLWSKTSITGPEDILGQPVIARGLDKDIVHALGADPVKDTERLLETALFAPETSAVIWGSLVHASAAGIPERFPFALRGALGDAGCALGLKIDLTLWQTFKPSEQASIAAATSAEYRAALADAEATRAAVEAAVAARYGATFSNPSAEFAAAVSRIAAAVVAHTAAHDTISSRIDHSYALYRRALGADGVNLS